MSLIKRVVLDVLKPHEPDIVQFAGTIADRHPECHVKISVVEVDAKTETIMVCIDSVDVPYTSILETITSLGASLHSIDEVEVSNQNELQC